MAFFSSLGMRSSPPNDDLGHAKTVLEADVRKLSRPQAGTMTGDFLPRRRQASVRTQLVTVVLVVAAATGAVYLLVNR